MYIIKPALLLISICLLTSEINSLSIPIISDIQDVIGLAGDVQNLMAGNVPFKAMITKAKNPMVAAIEMLNSVDQSLTELEATFNTKIDEFVETLIERIPVQGQIDRALDDFFEWTTRIEDLNEIFQYYALNVSNFNKVTIMDFMDVCTTADYGGIRDIITKLYRRTVPERTAGLIKGFFKLLDQRNRWFNQQQLCDVSESQQQQLYQIFNVIMMTEIRAFTMSLFAHKAKAEYFRVPMVREVARLRAEIVMRVSDYINEMLTILPKASRLLYRCDPMYNIRDENYIQLCSPSSGSLAAHSFSLRPQMANVQENMVVSNIKFTLKNNMVHLQIEESKMLPHAILDKSTAKWVDVEEFEYDNDNWYQVDPRVRLIKGQDFAFIRDGGTYGFDLDDVLAPDDYVITGVRLAHSYELDGEFENGSDLRILIFVTRYNFTNGELDMEDSNGGVWYTGLNQTMPPEVYTEYRHDIDIGTEIQEEEPPPLNNIDTKPNQEISFVPKSLDCSDGNVPSPLIDNRPAATLTTVPIGGVGFVYRSRADFIGFLALKMYTIEVANRLNSAITVQQFEFYKRNYRQKIHHPLNLKP